MYSSTKTKPTKCAFDLSSNVAMCAVFSTRFYIRIHLVYKSGFNLIQTDSIVEENNRMV